MVFFSVIYLHFAKQSIKKMSQRPIFLLLMYFILTKNLYLCTSNIRLLERDEWILLDKDPIADRQKQNRTPS